MAGDLLSNGGFEADWGEERSHRCLVFPEGGQPVEREIGNIFVPPGWTFWFRHEPGTWDQPEGRDAHREHDPRRVRVGEKAYMYFTFFRRHDAGLYQQVEVEAGTKLRLSAYAHAWSNTSVEGHEACLEDGRCSCGVGRGPAFLLEGEAPELTGDPWNDAIPNFTFWVGIDPTGGTDPFSDDVVWGNGAHIYNQHAQVPAAEAVAEGDVVTVFLRAKTLWPFKHNDAYWDDVALLALDATPPQVTLRCRPASQTIGQSVTIDIRSSTPLTAPKLTIEQPSGAELAYGAPVVGHEGGLYTWSYVTSPLEEVGSHSVVFSGDGVEREGTFEGTVEVSLTHRPAEPVERDVVTLEARAKALLRDVGLVVRYPSGAELAADPPAAGLEGDWHTWTYSLGPLNEIGLHTVVFSAAGGVMKTATFHVAEGEPRGLPRAQYERTYVLLPHDADEAWALAVVDATWEDRRYTIGGSADDAGIGDLDVRRVIAVNPDSWPTDLEAFFAEHYPAVEYTAIDAETPADLVRSLRRL